jgi:hypothetical protein
MEKQEQEWPPWDIWNRVSIYCVFLKKKPVYVGSTCQVDARASSHRMRFPGSTLVVLEVGVTDKERWRAEESWMAVIRAWYGPKSLVNKGSRVMPITVRTRKRIAFAKARYKHQQQRKRLA